MQCLPAGSQTIWRATEIAVSSQGLRQSLKRVCRNEESRSDDAEPLSYPRLGGSFYCKGLKGAEQVLKAVKEDKIR